MLTKPYPRANQHHAPRRQNGIVMIIALVVLVAMTLAAISLVRSVDTTNLIAGNLAFQQAATRSGDIGIEKAVSWLEGVNGSLTLFNDDGTNGYSATGLDAAKNPGSGESWDTFWTRVLASRAYVLPEDQAGNKVSYVIDRMCRLAGSPSGAGCVDSPLVTTANDNDNEVNQVQLTAASVVYYRITVRIGGPRNTVSYVQAVVSM